MKVTQYYIECLERLIEETGDDGWPLFGGVVKRDMKILISEVQRLRGALRDCKINSWAGTTPDGSILEDVFDDFVTGHNARIDSALNGELSEDSE